nr:unnamed protein product [Callosobruchus analis]
MKKGSLFNYESLVHATAAVAGSTFALSTFYPLDMVKFRVQMQDKDLLEKSAFQAIIHILKNEGITSLYRGLRVTVTTMGVSNFVYFYTFHGMKGFVPEEMEVPFTGLLDGMLHIASVEGAVSKSVATLLTYPLQLAQTRQRLMKKRLGTAALLLMILKKQGAKGLYQGMESKMLQTVLSTALMFVMYEKIVQFVFKLLLGTAKRKAMKG